MSSTFASIQNMRQELSDADLKAIARVRGFSVAEMAPGAFASFYLSETGLAAACATLTRDEVVTLHWLAGQARPVAIEFFGPLYGTEGQVWDSWPQRFRGTLKEVQQRLIRRGLVAVHEMASGAKTLMERWRFWLPKEFLAHLPPLLPTCPLEGLGTVAEDPFRVDLIALCQNSPSPLSVVDRRLLIDEAPFTASRYRKRQLDEWDRALRPPKEQQSGYQSPVPLILQGLQDAPDEHWVLGQDLLQVLSCLGRGQVPPDFADTGWRIGLLARHEVQGKQYYRAHPALQQSRFDVAGLRSGKGGVHIAAGMVTASTLERLARLSSMSVEAGHLVAAPHLVSLSKTSVDDALVAWLGENDKSYAAALAEVSARRGRTVVHSNLLVARVRDMALRAILDRTLGPTEVVHLAEEWMAFPRARLEAVERLVKKAGLPIRTVGPG